VTVKRISTGATKGAPSAADLQRYAALKRAVAEVGLVRRGSLVRRFMPCGKPGCRCQATPPELHGPYYQWTRKVHGKTVTLRLTESQAEALAAWIANGRRLDDIIAQMERLSLRITDRQLRALRNDST
jgi:hypothetical protein